MARTASAWTPARTAATLATQGRAGRKAYGDAGYYEKDGKIICKKCEVAINLATIGFKGGCNPIPFPYKTGHGKITIQTTDLDALSAHFR